MSRILVVEDEKLMQDLIVEYLLDGGHQVFTADDGIKAIEVFRKETIDLVILDIMMPKLDGFSVCRKIRKESDAIIIMLTAREDEDDKLLGYELGADDYVTKPFSPKVLMAKVNRLLKRFETVDANDKGDVLMEYGDLTIDPNSFVAKVNGEGLYLNKKEFDLLVLLARNEGKALGREHILLGIWGEDYFGDGRVLDTNIKTLRKKLGPCAKYIKTVIHVGYRFEVNQ